MEELSKEDVLFIKLMIDRYGFDFQEMLSDDFQHIKELDKEYCILLYMLG